MQMLAEQVCWVPISEIAGWKDGEVGCRGLPGADVWEGGASVLLELREEGGYILLAGRERLLELKALGQNCVDAVISPRWNLEERISGLLNRIGSRLTTGILAEAAKAGVPVYCPAIQDSMIGLQYWLFSQTHKVTVSAFDDMPGLLDRCFEAKRAGALFVGGGVPKNYILQSKLMTESGFDYAVQLTGDRPDLGGLSGATLDEARSWGKLTREATAVTVYGDATINLPLLVAATLERLEG